MSNRLASYLLRGKNKKIGYLHAVTETNKKSIIPARDPKPWGGAKGDEKSGGDDEDDDTYEST